MKKRLLEFWGGARAFCLLFIFATAAVFAQPTVIGTSVAGGTYGTFTLNTVGGFKQYRVAATSNAATGARTWEFVTGTAGTPDYATNWRPYSGGNTMSVNTFIPTSFANGAKYNTGSGGTSGLLPAIVSGRYYTFNVSNNAAADNVMSLLETTYSPVAVSTVSRTYNTIAITTSGTPNAAEYIYVRYSTNNFTTSAIVQATGSGTAWLADIPATGSITYYVYTSNKALSAINSDVASYGQVAHDMATLALNNNSNSNYSFTSANIASNAINGTDPGTTAGNYTTGQVVHANATANGISKGAGITGNAAANRYNATGFSTSGIDLTDYFEFTITPNANYRLNFTDLAYTFQSSSTGPNNIALRSSLDNYAANITTTTHTANTTASGSFNLSGASFQALTSAVTFRIYAWGGSGGTFSINDYAFNGTVDLAPAAPFLVISGNTAHGSVCPTVAAAPVTYTITNNGTVTATGVTVGSSDPQFVVSGLSSTTIASGGGTATYVVTFTPSSAGAKTATVTVNSATSGSNAPTSSLTGTGTTPVTGVVATSAATAVGNASATLNGNFSTAAVCPATTQKGFVYAQTSANNNPVNGGTGVTTTPVSGVATGTYTLPLSALANNTSYTFKAYIFDGTNYTYGATQTFTTLQPASQLAFVSVPASGFINANLAAFTVEARRPGGTVDAEYTGNITISKATGPGTLSGTLTVAATAGVATFSAAQFNALGTVTLAAASGALTGATSGNINITLAPVSLGNYPFTGSATTAGPAARMVASGVATGLTLGAMGRNTLTVNASSTSDDDVLSVSPATGNYGTAVNTALYIEFTATPSNGYVLNPTSISLSSARTSAGATNYAIRSSADGFAANLGTNTTTTSYATTSVSLSGSYTGAVTYRIYPYGGSGTGFWRVDNIVLNGNVLCVNPTVFNVTGGGTTCATGTGVAVGLDGSQLHMNYQLKLGGVNQGSPVAGTGSALNFGLYNTGGTYTVDAVNTNGSCNLTVAMNGSAVVVANPPSVGGTVTGGNNVCFGTNSTLLTLNGYVGTIQWQSSADGVTYADLSGETSATYTATNLTASTYYRAVLTSGLCIPAHSDAHQIVVTPLAVAGTVSADQAVCGGTLPADMTLSGSVGTIQWQSSLDNNTFADIAGQTSATLAAAAVGPVTATTYFRAVVTSGTCGSATSGVITVAVSSTTWNGSWTNGVPTSATAIVIAANYTTTGDLSGCSMVVENGANVTVATGHNITLNGTLTVATGATFTVENNANLVQLDGGANSGAITVKRNSNALMRLDYTLWSAPVSGSQTLQAFSPGTVSNRFYVYNPATDLYNVTAASGTFAQGIGYLIRTPNNHPVTPTVWSGSFTGVPNNGNVSVPVTAGTFNAVGNPYPSTLSADDFITTNNITEALYFWRKTNNAATTAYATYTLAGGAGTAAGEGDPNGAVPNGVIQVGQGFIAKTAANAIVFNNSMRVANNDGQFFRQAAMERHRIWVNMTSADGIFSQAMVAYMSGATQGVDAAIDGLYFNDSEIALTSLINGQEYAVQGRALPFDGLDVVPMGFKVINAGTYSIGLDHADGLFADANQAVILRDLQTGAEFDLRTGNYSFTTEAGVFHNRFEIVYQTTLAVQHPSAVASDLIVYRKAQQAVVQTQTQQIVKTELFDILGKQLSARIWNNLREVRVDLPAANQVLIVKATLANGTTVSRKLVN